MPDVPLIPPGVDVAAGHKDLALHAHAKKKDLTERWDGEEGRKIIAAWRQSSFDRSAIEGLVGKFYGKPDLRGIRLEREDLSGKDISDLELYCAILRNSKFVAANVQGSHLSEADIRGADFSWARMRGVFLDNAEFDGKTNFLGVPLHEVNFNLAALIQEHAQTQQRIAHLKKRNPLLAKFLWATCDYGRSLGRWVAWVCVVIVMFGVIYNNLPAHFPDCKSFLDAVYFSVVTFSTLGYGDISPKTDLGKVIVISEVVVGYMMGGLLVAILSRRLLGS